MKKWSRQTWRRYVGIAGFVGAAGTAIDVPLHAWPQLGITLGATGVTLVASRFGFRAAAEREAHKPDYEKIKRLEIELGLVEAPNPKPQGGPFLCQSQPRPVEWVRPAPPGPPLTPPVPRPLIDRPLIPDAVPGSISDYYNHVQRSGRWQTCSVCMRQHEGKCAG